MARRSAAWPSSRTMGNDTQGVAGEETSRAPGGGVAAAEAAEIAVDGYIYGYPLVLAETSRRVMSNVDPAAAAAGFGASMNQFAHRRAFPDPKFTDVVRPNADTLYSSLWFDVAKEPLIISVPDSGGRYYLLPMLDMWTDVFASPGKRTTGTAARRFGLVGPDWDGDLPRDIEPIRAPTSAGWVIGRTQTNGKADFDAVHEFQAGISAVPLSAWGSYYEPPEAKFDRGASKLAPSEQVERMDGATFFAFLAELLRLYAPHANDYPMLQRLARIGLQPGRPYDVAAVSPEIRSALTAAPAAGLARIADFLPRSDIQVNGWMLPSNPIGTYGTAYLKRALVARTGLGANVIEDAFYPSPLADADGKPLSSGRALRRAFREGAAAAGARVLVADHVRRPPAVHGEPDRSLRDRRPRRHEAQQRRVAGHLHPAPGAGRRQAAQLAAGAGIGRLQHEPAAVLARARGDRRPLGAAARETRDVTESRGFAAHAARGGRCFHFACPAPPRPGPVLPSSLFRRSRCMRASRSEAQAQRDAERCQMYDDLLSETTCSRLVSRLSRESSAKISDRIGVCATHWPSGARPHVENYCRRHSRR